jgi:hypothetical protein
MIENRSRSKEGGGSAKGWEAGRLEGEGQFLRKPVVQFDVYFMEDSLSLDFFSLMARALSNSLSSGDSAS